jgi:hypothetical protein
LKLRLEKISPTKKQIAYSIRNYLKAVEKINNGKIYHLSRNLMWVSYALMMNGDPKYASLYMKNLLLSSISQRISTNYIILLRQLHGACL